MAAELPNNDEIVAQINITPLVDVMLVLLIIFMVTATFMKDPVIPVKLPRAATAEDAPANSVALVLDERGILYFNGQEVLPQEVKNRLGRMLRRDSKTSVIVAADGRIEYDSVARVIDLIKSTGVQEFSLNVRRPAGSAGASGNDWP